MSGFNGIVNVLKSPGISSGAAVACVRGILGEKRVGHGGTLDPGAAGVLPICVGRSTRLFDYLLETGKEYIAEVLFGVETDTLDTYGNVIKSESCEVTEDMVNTALNHFIGECDQIPPLFSAVKVGGVPSYKRARRGETQRKPPRRVTIYSAEAHEVGKNRFLLRILCSKGTYIRVLLNDMGAFLGVPAVMTFLLRTMSGGLSIDSAYTLDEIRANAESGDFSFVLPPESVLERFERLDVDSSWRFALENGREIPVHKDGIVRLYSDGFMGLARSGEMGTKLILPLY